MNNGPLSSMNVLQVVCQKPHGAKPMASPINNSFTGIFQQEAYQQMESQSPSPASSALIPDVKEEKASHPAFVEIRSVTSEIESSTFSQDVIIHSENLTVEISNTASEELLRKLRGIVHVK